MIYDPSIETHLNNVFSQAAADMEKELKGKKYKYSLDRGMFFSKHVADGICIINSCRYDSCQDCDIYTITDCNTNKHYICNQFEITLEEIG